MIKQRKGQIGDFGHLFLVRVCACLLEHSDKVVKVVTVAEKSVGRLNEATHAVHNDAVEGVLQRGQL